jgi:hypothetical protein
MNWLNSMVLTGGAALPQAKGEPERQAAAPFPLDNAGCIAVQIAQNV